MEIKFRYFGQTSIQIGPENNKRIGIITELDRLVWNKIKNDVRR